MAEIINLRNHSSLLRSSEIKEICKPLLRKSGIDYFTFIRQFNDHSRSRICLTTAPGWHKHFCESKHYLTDKFELPFGAFTNGYFSWAMLKDTTVYCDAASHFDIVHGITMIDKQLSYCDFYHFGASAKKRLNSEIYITRLSDLQAFTFYFQEKARKIILTSDTIIFPDWEAINKTKPDKKQQIRKEQTNFAEQLNVKRYYLGEAFNHVYLTAREMEFIRWMAQGKTAWEIAKIMGISARTVEAHSENIKRKLNCVKLQQVIWKLRQTNLLNLIYSNGMNPQVASYHEDIS